MTTTWDERMAALERPSTPPLAATTPPTPIAAEPAYALGLEDAARYLGVSLATMRRLMDDGALPSFNLRGRRMVRRVDVEAMVDDLVAAGYRFPQPRTAGECRIAAEQCAREATELRRQAERTPYPGRAERYRAAAQAYAALATWFRWESGADVLTEGAA